MLESLNCNSCGAPLDVPSSANFVKCNHCNANLQVHRSDGVTFTEAVDKLNQTTEDLVQQVEKLTQQNELAALDRQWEIERRSFMTQSKNGQQHLPHQGAAWMIGIVPVVFGSIWTVLAFSITRFAPDIGPFAVAKIVFPLFGVAFVAFGIMAMILGYKSAQNYRSAERNYQRRRQDLMRED